MLRWRAVLGLLPVVALSGSACLGYSAEGAVSTPAPPGQDSPSRLPQLLQQLQAGGAGLELFDSPQNQVLAAQDAQGKGTDTTPAAGETVAGARTPGITTVAQQPPATNTPTPRPGTQPTPTRTPTPSASPSASPTASGTATTSSTSTPTPTPTPTGTPTIPNEGSGPTPTPATPPTES